MFVMATLLWDLSRAAVSPDIAGKNRIPGIVFIIACAAGAAAVVKASSWIFVFASLAMGMIVLLRAQEIAWASRRNAALASGSVVAIMLGTWIWRSVQLSGYPFFPSTFLPLPVPWRIPIEYASWSGWWISAFARGTSDVSQNTGEQMVLIPAWFSAQWRVFKIEVVLPLALMGATAATYLFASPPRRASFRGALAATRLAILPTAVSLAFWYVTAPSVRFGAALLWIAAAMAASAGLHLVLEERAQRRAIFAVLALPVLCAGQHIVVAAKETHTSIAQAAGPVLFVPCGAGNCFYPPPSSQLEKITTRSGLTAYTPAARNCGDREYIKCLIWNAPLPAAGLIRPTLAYLDPNRPTVGFVTQERAGEWLQLFGDEIRAAHATQHLGIQELANRFRVHPRYIRQALGIP
jgi:hypothetical protein